jgi:ABC-type multidrug transport system fused ATPase/permease subunit
VPNAVLDQCTKTLTMITMVSLVCIFAPWCLFIFPCLIKPYLYIFTRCRTASRDARRLEARAHSPVYTHFSDALSGRSTILAFGAQDRFKKKNLALTSSMAAANYTREAAQKWAQALTTQTGCILYFAAGVICVVLNSRGAMTSSNMGLVLLYAAQLQRAMMVRLLIWSIAIITILPRRTTLWASPR